MQWLGDLGVTIRVLRRQRSFAIPAIVLLALGIGLGTAAFSVVDQLLWSPPPGIERDAPVVAIYGSDEEGGVSVASYVDLRELPERTRAFSAVAATKLMPMELGFAEGGSETVAGMLVDASYFRALGLAPARGRFLQPAETARPGAPVVVLAHHVWRNRLGGKPLVGRTVLLDGSAFTVVGVAPAGFRGTSVDDAADLFVPFALQPWFMGRDLLDERGWGGVVGVARLAPGVGFERAAAELDRAAAAMERDYPETNEGRRMTLEPLAASPLSAFGRETWGRGALLVAITCGLVLLVACLNVANLLSARATARREELALRQALGASRGRLARELVAESAVLALVGCALGTVVAQQALALLSAVVPGGSLALRLDGRALVAALALAALTALGVSALPALENRWQLAMSLRRGEGRRASRARRVLVAVQVAVSLVLLVAAGLLARTLLNLRQVPLGFAPEPLLAASLGIDPGLTRDEGLARWRVLLAAAASVPGVERAAVSSVLPGDNAADQLGAMIEGREGRRQLSVPVQTISPGYFTALGVPLAAGRDITDGEEVAGAAVGLVNESFARLHWPDRPAVGQRIELIGGPAVTVVGVARDSLVRTLRERSAPMAYLPWSLSDPELPRELALVARVSGPPERSIEPLRSALTEAGARRLRHLAPLEERLEASAAGERLASLLLGSISGMALVLTALGLYSLLAWSVSQRTRELGVRAALGAHRGRLRRLVLGEALRLTAAGAALGAAGAYAASRALEGLLYGVPPHDPWTLTGAGLVLVATATVAAWWPARRATRIDPMTALRE